MRAMNPDKVRAACLSIAELAHISNALAGQPQLKPGAAQTAQPDARGPPGAHQELGRSRIVHPSCCRVRMPQSVCKCTSKRKICCSELANNQRRPWEREERYAVKAPLLSSCPHTPLEVFHVQNPGGRIRSRYPTRGPCQSKENKLLRQWKHSPHQRFHIGERSLMPEEHEPKKKGNYGTPEHVEDSPHSNDPTSQCREQGDLASGEPQGTRSRHTVMSFKAAVNSAGPDCVHTWTTAWNFHTLALEECSKQLLAGQH
eukprot:1154955-Pelagomonas_calceolata.AAC.10